MGKVIDGNLHSIFNKKSALCWESLSWMSFLLLFLPGVIAEFILGLKKPHISISHSVNNLRICKVYSNVGGWCDIIYLRHNTTDVIDTLSDGLAPSTDSDSSFG